MAYCEQLGREPCDIKRYITGVIRRFGVYTLIRFLAESLVRRLTLGTGTKVENTTSFSYI